MKQVSIIDTIQLRYERRGECKRCGKCCIGENCEYLKIENGLAICVIHDDGNRPEKCKIFPALPPIVFKSCSYVFLDKWENKILKAGEI